MTSVASPPGEGDFTEIQPSLTSIMIARSQILFLCVHEVWNVVEIFKLM